MATFPTESTRWATDGAADLVDPPSGKRDIGWLDAEKPPAEYFNYWMNAVYKSIDFVKTNMLQKDGSVPFTGTVKADVNATRDIGELATRFGTAFLASLNVSGRIFSDYVPRTVGLVKVTGAGVITNSHLKGATTSIVGGQLRVTMLSQVLDGNYPVFATATKSPGLRHVTLVGYPGASQRTGAPTSYFDIQVFDTAGVAINLSSLGADEIVIEWQAFGQTP